MKRANVIPAACLVAFALFSGCDEIRTSEAAADKGTTKAEQTSQANQQGEDMGKKPWVLDIEEATVNNPDYRHVRWTGEHLQMVLMSLKPGEEIDLERHDDVDQFLRIEQGEAQVRMGKSKDDLSFDKKVSDHWAIFIPSGYWHHVKNTGNKELKLYSIYAPAQHPAGTVHKNYKEAQAHHESLEHDH
ncbi:cupin domain-containing protein [Pontibacter mangrovi]|uniref:Cupin domain-containing protein n=1 Tax=Pontibacter mangrovi TaxID=2589816 RepID=A0A501W7J4_9BACT|nr:cupin domain-containing protein [Pontibacter mangrovi]TPE42837.1 cupin domain-containing protein [Pontibacter mangrovi]